MTVHLVLRPYAEGDAARIDMDEPCPEKLLTGRPQGRAYTAFELSEKRVPIACIGWHEKDGALRVWARTQKGLGHSHLRALWAFAHDLLETESNRPMLCTAPNAVAERLFSRFGFRSTSKLASFPKLMIREPAQ